MLKGKIYGNIWINGFMDKWMYGHTVIWINCYMDIWTNGYMDLWIYGDSGLW